VVHVGHPAVPDPPPNPFRVYSKLTGRRKVFYVTASQTLRPKLVAGFVLDSHLQWQFYCEELDVILVRRDLRKFVALDDHSREFFAFDDEQTRFG
jgi:hypothetical protein